MKLTIKDIARECKVSPAAISNALNNKGRLKEDTRKKILATIKKLKYDPYKNMPWVRKTSTKFIGFVIPASKSDSFYNYAMARAKNAISEKGYNCIMYFDWEIARITTDELHKGRNNIPCDGLIFFCPYQNWDQSLQVLKSWDIPCTLIRRETRIKGVTMLSDNDSQGTLTAMQYLHQLGHRRIGLITVDPGIQNFLEARRRTYEEFMGRPGLENNAAWTFVFAQNRHAPVFDDWLKNVMDAPSPPTAFFCWDDDLAIRLIKSLARLGRRVPDDVAVVGYDNDYVGEQFHPALTTVNIPVTEMIEMACRIVFDELNGREGEKVLVEKISTIEFTNELVIRESCGARLTGKQSVVG